MFRQFFIYIFLLIPVISFGQEIKPKASFQKDTILIGESVPFSVWITYPRDLDVLFPDSLYDFSPFEIERKTYFLTKSDSVYSTDSVVYFLTTFEIDSIQRLSLPIYVIDEYDSSIVQTPPDSIILEHLVTELPDSVALRVDTSYTKVPLEFNYPYMIIGVSAGILIIVIVMLVFGKTFKRQIVLFRLRRQHKRFMKKFDSILAGKLIDAEKSLVVWKKYMERLSSEPYTKLTSKEINALLGDKDLKLYLKNIDRVIYGHGDQGDLKSSLHGLQEKAVEEYTRKTEEVKHG